MTLNQEKKTVDILIATYNGEKFIRAQLLSLLYQTYSNIRVLIHDDGSTDNTVEIVREIAKKDERIVFIDDGITLGSAAKNFMHVLKYSDADVAMFCDQDDIWFDNKVEVMLEALSGKDEAKPHVIFSSATLWYPESGVDGNTIIRYPNELRFFLFRNGGIQGCATMFNKAMRDLMLRWKGDLLMHDHLLGLLSLTIGDLTFVNRSLMLYRRHPASVTAGGSFRLTFKEQVCVNHAIPVVHAKNYETVAKFLEIYKSNLKESDKSLIEAFLEMKEMSVFGRMFSVIRHHFGIYDSVLMLLFKLMIRPYYGEVPFDRQLVRLGGAKPLIQKEFLLRPMLNFRGPYEASRFKRYGACCFKLQHSKTHNLCRQPHPLATNRNSYCFSG